MKEIVKRWNPWWLYDKVPELKKRITRPETLDGITKLLDIKERSKLCLNLKRTFKEEFQN
ncbi:hypothetical protein C5S42_13090 [Candidatus Methanomarinus sp.]|nr:hypothetical protein C5S42_13090 [ANME-2 cluster archaeon]